MATKSAARRTRRAGSGLHDELLQVIAAIRASPDCFPSEILRTRITLATADGARLEIEIDGASAGGVATGVVAGVETGVGGGVAAAARGTPATARPKRAPASRGPSRAPASRERPAGLAPPSPVDALGLNPNAKAAAQNLLAAFPDDVVFTSGRRSIAEQASAMAGNVTKNRRWIEQTYKRTPQRAALQAWVDANPDATSARAIAAGLLSVMDTWTDPQRRAISKHISGDAFDVRPVGGAPGARIKAAIAQLPRLDWHTFSEGGREIWHAQFAA